MIKISKIEIVNYRSCIKTTIDVQDNLTTLIGINGVGKSNILNSLLLLKKINRNRFFHQEIIQETLKHTGLKLFLTIDKISYTLKSDIYIETDENNLDDVLYAEIFLKKSKDKTQDWRPIPIDLFSYVERLKIINKPFNDRKIQDDYLKSEEGQIAIQIVDFLISISYYSATQFADPTRCPVSISIQETEIQGIKNRESHSMFIYDLYSSYKSENKSFIKYVNIINKNGIGLIEKIKFTEHKYTELNNRTVITPIFEIDGQRLSPNQLSEGTFKTLALIFYVLNDKSELLLIEEPEVCVHHGLLNSVIALIKQQSKEKQIIISTHSDFVLDKLKPENIILVKKDIQKGTLADKLSKTMSKDDYSALKEYLKTSGNLGEYWKEGGFENE